VSPDVQTPVTSPEALTSLGESLRPVAPAAARLRELVRSAILAPSSHNAQPWIFHIPVNSAFVELYADRTRALPVMDPDDRELTMSCGSALFNLRLAARHAGFTDLVEPLPDPDDPDLLARVRLGSPYVATDAERALFAVIPHRHTNRHAFVARAVPPELLKSLQLAASAEGALLCLLRTPTERMRAAELVAEGDRKQGADRAFRRELASWLHPNRAHTRDGMPGYALGLGDWSSYVGPLVVRTFDWGGGQAARDRDLALGSPVMAILWTVTDTVADWVNAGQALQRVLLRATVDDVSASFLNQPVEVPALRALMREEFGISGYPQTLLRLGYGPAVENAMPRRPVEDVMR
jgi:hypothetical protein